MKYIKTVVGAVIATALFVTAVSAAPSTNAPVAKSIVDSGRWTLSLSGVGSSAVDSSKFNNSTIGGEVALGHTGQFILPLEAGVRQGISYSDSVGSVWRLSTKVFSDWTLVRLGNLQFDVGGNVGVAYGNQALTWTAAPEVVSRLYLKKDVDVFGRVEYPFDLSAGKAEKSLIYTLGIRVGF